MGLLVSGLLLWSFVHLFKRLAPVPYHALQDKIGVNGIKGLTTLLLFAAFMMLIFGYKAAPYIELYYLPDWSVHLNNLLMAISIFLLVSSYGTGMVKAKLRHPMLMAAIFWSGAHLLVNGDFASIILFAGIAGWADAEIMLINVRDTSWKPAEASWKGDLISLAMTIPVFIIITILHGYLGPSPFPG